MGREAICHCRLDGRSSEVKALLEAHALLLRGAVKRHFPLQGLCALRVEGEALCFTSGTESVVLELGAQQATRWIKKIQTPPPSLASKLGVSAHTPAWVHGTVDDPQLLAALHGATRSSPARAQLALIVAHSEAALHTGLGAYAEHALTCPLWIVYPKGRNASLGEATVRSTLRGLGFMDNKTSAVSDQLTATRYARR